jgi:hypothetical protein
MRLNLSTDIPSDNDWFELHRVVLGAEFCRAQQKSQNLRIGLGGPAGCEVEQQEHKKPSGQAIEKVECGGAQAHRKEEEFPLGTEDREWPG